MAKHSTDILELARLGAAARIKEHEAEIAKLRRILIHQPSARASTQIKSSGSSQRRKRRKLSAAARKRISEAQKARWAKQKAGKKR